jgi:1-acyl-sn-glycerol-3-phosphate acyltransferase
MLFPRRGTKIAAVRFLRSLWAWFVIVVATLGFGIPSIFAAFVPPRGKWYLPFARGWARTVLAGTGVRVRTTGKERAATADGCIYFANHESLFDIFVLLAALPGRLRFLAKKSLFSVPILGWSMAAAGYVPVDRDDRRQAAESLEIAAQRLRGGMRMIIFPEQTRTRTGEMLPFKKGGVILALRTGASIVPVAIAGTFAIQQRGGFWLAPGPVEVEIGDPIAVAGMTIADRTALTAETRRRIETLLAAARGRLPLSAGSPAAGSEVRG